MKRSLEKQLIDWKDRKRRMPLLIRGARQVGKTYLVKTFGKKYFDNLISINFEKNKEYKQCFKTLEPTNILSQIETITNIPIVEGKTLIFFDEIQECPNAIMALRYFKEEMPHLHVIGAGSLLEFALNKKDFRMPVGRVEFLFLKPFSFEEFLIALRKDRLLKQLYNLSIKDSIEPIFHEKLIDLIRKYIALGGMPAVIDEYIQTKSLRACQDIQSYLLETYQNDFMKYATNAQFQYLQLLFEKAPGLLAQWFKYTKVDPHIHPREIKTAIDQLCKAGIIYQVFSSSGSGMPLISTINMKKFKLLFLDIGLMKRACKLDMDTIFHKDLHLINQGALTEQFVGQELLAHMNPKETAKLFFWVREKIGSSAEVDYLINNQEHIIPIEVKSGSTGRLKSLRIFMEEKKCPVGIRINSEPFNIKDNILSIPFYLINQIPRLLKEFLNDI